MRRMKDRIEAVLQPLEPLALDVHDRSAEHRGHSGWRDGGETHFDVKIVSSAFIGQSRIARHRMVNDLLAPLLEERIHALSLMALTPDEADRQAAAKPH
jgi:BolA protein